MNVAELIAALQALPQDAPVYLHWDGCSRTPAEATWQGQGGHVIISDLEQPVYDDTDRIAGAPLSRHNYYIYVYEMLGVAPPKREDEI